jgi:3D (Asp-Asp-Asp) domain-containing protein
MQRRQRIRHILSLFNGRVALWGRRARVQVVLAAWLVPDRVGRVVSRLRDDFPVAKTVVAILLCAAVVVPSVLYHRERSQRIETQRAYSYLRTSSSAEITTLCHSLEALLDEQQEIRSELLQAGYPVVSDDRLAIRLLATGYSSCVWETDDTPFITASNTRTRKGVVALSRDLLRRYDSNALFAFGDAIHISGLGDFIVEDSMHWRWRNRIDLWFPSKDEARRFGKRWVTVSMPLGEPSETASDDDKIAEMSSASGFSSSSETTQ